ncbi:MAM and LDL-receptor class A domain-containing protein 1-like isoform X2 [Oscarella lobularis]|uniref:MAM and LDL-receptor class A domain-containing protein 1-like isoform X2 n=1 Tax=Oscarella lobularis TaxID=121494 RepID=UPI003313E1DF
MKSKKTSRKHKPIQQKMLQWAISGFPPTGPGEVTAGAAEVTGTVCPDNEETENDEEEEEELMAAATLDKRTTEITQEERGMQSINNYLINVVSGQSVCTFDQGMCGWTNAKSNDVDWTRNQGSTPSLGTGLASVDHTNGTAYGYYIYFETSGLQSQAISTLASPVLNPTQSSPCQISIACHMSGNQVGTLEVLLHPQYSERLLWSRQGDQGNRWNVANITIGSVQQSFQVYVRATHVQCFTSSCYRGDIALDDLKFTGCSFAPNGVTLAPPTLPPPLQWPNQSCTFEQDMCQWDNVFTNRVDWIRRQGYTPSYGTGPSDDYTFRNGSGHYIYVETSSRFTWAPLLPDSSYRSLPRTVAEILAISLLTS